MRQVGIVVEGATDVPVVAAILASRGLEVHPHRQIITNGKSTWDRRVERYNAAARHGPWLALRDSDRDGCPVNLRRELLDGVAQEPMMSLRLAVRSIDAWLLADREKFAEYFAVSVDRVPLVPEEADDAKRELVSVCRQSRRAAVRSGMVPARGQRGVVGREYASFIIDFSSHAWRPDRAARSAPSLASALAEIDRMVEQGIWT